MVDSHNRWVTIHGTQYLVVRDCVGYRSVGHGYFLEDATEVYNLLDRNLGVQAFHGKRLAATGAPVRPERRRRVLVGQRPQLAHPQLGLARTTSTATASTSRSRSRSTPTCRS